MSEEVKMDDVFDLGTWLGRRQAFAAVAGRSSAADAECLRTIRQKKLYRARGVTWDQFCHEYAGMSRSLADQLIRQLEEFGPGYFRLAEVAKITPTSFRQIAPSVCEDGVSCNGEVIRFTPENAGKIAAALEQLRARAQAEQPPSAAEDPARRLERARKGLAAALAEVERVSSLPRNIVERQSLRAAIDAAIQHLTRLTAVVPN